MKIFFLVGVLFYTSLMALDIPEDKAILKEFGASVELNSQIIQLSNSSQSVMSLVSGHIEKYYVKVGQKIKEGQKIVLIKSMLISQMTANYIAQKEQLLALEKNSKALQNLYDKGMISLQEVNQQSIQKNELLSTLTALKSQLNTLGINTNKLKEASSHFVLYAHSDGVVSKILQAEHSSVQEDTPIISLVKEQAFYLKSFLPLKYASKAKIGQKTTINLNGKTIVSHVTQILPQVDEKTQRIVLLSSIDEETENLYINSYIASKLYFSDTKKYVAIKKSALSFFNNEWVVFLHKEEKHEEEKHEEADEHEGHGHDEEPVRDEHEGHGHEEDAHDEHKELGADADDDHTGHDEEEEEAAYEVRVVNIITEDDEYVGVEGIHEGEEYISGKSYYVKSMLFKSALGGHGH